jgi:hypothetical protein
LKFSAVKLMKLAPADADSNPTLPLEVLVPGPMIFRS